MVDETNDNAPQQVEESTEKSPASVNQFEAPCRCRRDLLGYIARRFSGLKLSIARISRNLRKLDQTIERNGKELCQCFHAVKSCQEQTAKILNNEMERHALNPAIESVVSLAGELIRLEQLGKELIAQTDSNPQIERLLDELAISSQIAHDKLAYLDIVRITATRGDVFNAQMHSIASCQITEDSVLHGRISEIITAGTIYRGKVLKQARVSIFKYEQRYVNTE